MEEIKNENLEQYLKDAGIELVVNCNDKRDEVLSYRCYLEDENKDENIKKLQGLKDLPFFIDRNINIRTEDKHQDFLGKSFIYITQEEFNQANDVFESIYGELKKSSDEFIEEAKIEYIKKRFADDRIELLVDDFELARIMSLLPEKTFKYTQDNNDKKIYLEKQDIEGMTKKLKNVEAPIENRQEQPTDGKYLDMMSQILGSIDVTDDYYLGYSRENMQIQFHKIDDATKFVNEIYKYGVHGPFDVEENTHLKRRIHKIEDGQGRGGNVVYVTPDEINTIYKPLFSRPSPVATKPQGQIAHGIFPEIIISEKNIFGTSGHDKGSVENNFAYIDPASPETVDGMNGRNGALSGAIYEKIKGGYSRVLNNMISIKGKDHKIFDYESTDSKVKFGVLSIAGPEGSKIKDPAEFTQELKKAYKTMIKTIIERKDDYKKFNVPLISGGEFADVHKPNMGQITAKAIYSAIKEISQDGKNSSEDLEKALSKTELCCANQKLKKEIRTQYQALKSQARGQGAAAGGRN